MKKFKVYKIISNSNLDMLGICTDNFSHTALIDNQVYIVTQDEEESVYKKIQSVYTANFFVLKITSYVGKLKEFIESLIVEDCIKKNKVKTGEVEKHYMSRNEIIYDIIQNIREQEKNLNTKI